MIKKHSFQIIFFNCFFFCMLGYSQDTVRALSEVNVSSFELLKMKTLELTSQSYSRNQILYLQPEDVGAILQKFSGTAMKSYGGLGGLKTVSVRGLGSQHTTFLIDGFTINNTQTGQINLGQIQTDNVENVTLSTGGRNGFLLPASAYLNGSLVTINTFENIKSNEKIKVRFASRVGSFGEIDNYLTTKFSSSKSFVSCFGKFRQANGKYPYTLQNGNFSYNGQRFNNDLKDWYSGISLGARFKNQAELRCIYKTNGSNQGLPGAVILYNEMANQRLSTQAHNLNIDFIHQFKQIAYRLFGTYNQDWLHYSDPFYLNNSGGISTVFSNNSSQLGISVQRKLGENSIVFGGLESRYSELHFSTSNSAKPRRLHSFGLVGFNYNRSKWTSEIQVSVQSVVEENKTGERAANRLKMNPFLAIEKNEFGKWKWKIKGWYRNSFRMPSFNELYYNNIGNVNLKPEQANQLTLGFSLKPIQKKMDLMLLVNGFASRVENQILAIPTKNLFVWSMQNIGRVNTFGFESRARLEKCFRMYWYTDVDLNYTYQYSVDVSDKKSPTFFNQVAYIPRHTGNFNVSIKRKNTGIQLSSTLSSIRYSLTENIISNQVDGFSIYDVAVFSKVNFKNSQSIRIQFSMKNMFDSNYSYIRYFVMPGRNYLVTLNYAFN